MENNKTRIRFIKYATTDGTPCLDILINDEEKEYMEKRVRSATLRNFKITKKEEFSHSHLFREEVPDMDILLKVIRHYNETTSSGPPRV